MGCFFEVVINAMIQDFPVKILSWSPCKVVTEMSLCNSCGLKWRDYHNDPKAKWQTRTLCFCRKWDHTNKGIRCPTSTRTTILDCDKINVIGSQYNIIQCKCESTFKHKSRTFLNVPCKKTLAITSLDHHCSSDSFFLPYPESHQFTVFFL